MARFIRERTMPVDQLRDGIKRAKLFLEFQRWCEQENLTMVARGSRNTFFEKVRNNGGIEGKDTKGINRWRYRLRRPGDNDPSETATPEGPNGSSVSETAVAKPAAVKGEVSGKRQQRQKPVKKSEIDSGALNNQPPSENRYGQGYAELPLVPFLSGVTPAIPAPYKGEPPTGIDYICRAVDLPDLDGMAMSIGFDLETFNRRTDLWRHKASLSPSLGGEIRLAQLTGADSKKHAGRRCGRHRPAGH